MVDLQHWHLELYLAAAHGIDVLGIQTHKPRLGLISIPIARHPLVITAIQIEIQLERLPPQHLHDDYPLLGLLVPRAVQTTPLSSSQQQLPLYTCPRAESLWVVSPLVSCTVVYPQQY